MRRKMCGKNFAYWFCALFLLISSSSSNSQKNYINNKGEDGNLTRQYKIDADSTIKYGNKMKMLQYDLYKKSTNNIQNDKHRTNSTSNNREDNDSGQNKFGTHFIKNHESDNYMLMKLYANSTNFNSEKNFTSHWKMYRDLRQIESNNNSTLYSKTFNGDDNKYNIVPYEMCDNITCISLCCPLGDRLIDDKCISKNNKILPLFSNVYEYMTNSSQTESKRVDELFHLVVHNPCLKSQHTHLLDSNSKNYSEYKYIFLNNGSLYLPQNHIFVESTSYCLADMQQNEFDVIICSETVNHENQKIYKKIKDKNNINILYTFEEERENNLVQQNMHFYTIVLSLYVVSTLILLATFLVYSLLTELRNAHGFILCMYTGFLIASHSLDISNILIQINRTSSSCYTMYIVFPGLLCALASYFWLTVMSFNTWWTFRKLDFFIRSTKKQEKKKLIIYTIYAVGFPCIITIFCIIINNISSVPEDFRWFVSCGTSGYMAYMLYFFMPKSICTVSSVCLCILVALKIRRYEKNAVSHLRDSLSKNQYDENKKWFNMYLKLFVMVFIIIGVQWFMQAVYVLYHKHHQYKLYKDIVVYILYLSDVLVNLGIFVIFVCKKRIMLLLLKRFGCQKYTSETRHDMDGTFASICNTEDICMENKSLAGI